MDKTPNIEYVTDRIGRSRRLSAWLFEHLESMARLADGDCFIKRRRLSPEDEVVVESEYVSRVDCRESSDPRGASPEICSSHQVALYGEGGR